MFDISFYKRLEKSENILIAGAGGGNDVYSGIPLYFNLLNQNKNVFLANLSFVDLDDTNAEQIINNLYKVDIDTEGYMSYFPEKHLSEWFEKSENISVPIYCFKRTGVVELLNCYEYLIEKLNLDTIILADGGTDSLMKGDEVSLGTPEEDIASIAAVYNSSVCNKFLVCLGFGIDYFHGICHSQCLEAISELIRADGFLGSVSLQKEMIEVQKFIDAVDFSNKNTHRYYKSIVSNSITDSIRGMFGDYHSLERTKGSKLFINPLMSFYWFFDLDKVAKRCLYLDKVINTKTYNEIVLAVARYRESITRKDWEDIRM